MARPHRAASTRVRAQLTREGKLTNEEFDKMDKQAKETALASVKFAEKSPEPPLEELYDYTYANGVETGVPPAKKTNVSPANGESSAQNAFRATTAGAHA